MVKKWKIPLKRGSQSNIALGAPIFCSRHQRVRKNLIFIHPQDEGPRGTTFKKKKNTLIIITFLCKRKKRKIGFYCFGSHFWQLDIGVTFYKENFLDLNTTFGVRGKIEPKNGYQSNYCFGSLLKKTITPVRGLQILGPSRILLYYRGASFNITMSKLVNYPFNF